MSRGAVPAAKCLMRFSSQGLPGPPGEKGETGDVGQMVRVTSTWRPGRAAGFCFRGLCIFSALNGSALPRALQVPPAPEDPLELPVLTDRKVPLAE